jgi:hypothetical protein
MATKPINAVPNIQNAAGIGTGTGTAAMPSWMSFELVPPGPPAVAVTSMPSMVFDSVEAYGGEPEPDGPELSSQVASVACTEVAYTAEIGARNITPIINVLIAVQTVITLQRILIVRFLMLPTHDL